MKILRFAGLMFLLLATATLAFGQQKEFDKAVKKGRKQGEYYFVDLSNKGYTKKEIQAFAKEKGYSLRNIREDKVAVYGTIKQIVVSVEMLPVGETLGSPSVISSNSSKDKAPERDIWGEKAKSIQKLFKTASKKPKDVHLHGWGYFVELDTEIQYYTRKEIEKAMEGQPYYLLGFTGDNPVYRVAFAPEEELASVIYVNSFSKRKPFSELKKGEMYYYTGEVFKNVYWSGDVVNGKIQGSGYGVWHEPGKNPFTFSGTFSDGKLTGTGFFNRGEPAQSMETKNGMQVKMFPFKNGLARMECCQTPDHWEDNYVLSEYKNSLIGKKVSPNLYWVNQNFKPVISLTADSQGHYSLGRNLRVEDDDRNGYIIIVADRRNSLISYPGKSYVEYKISRKTGAVSFSDEQAAIIRNLAKQILGKKDYLIGEFLRSFPQNYYSEMNELREWIQFYDTARTEFWGSSDTDEAVKDIPGIEDLQFVKDLLRLCDIVNSDVSINLNLSMAYTYTFSNVVNTKYMENRRQEAYQIINQLQKNGFSPAGFDTAVAAMKEKIEVKNSEFEKNKRLAAAEINQHNDAVRQYRASNMSSGSSSTSSNTSSSASSSYSSTSSSSSSEKEESSEKKLSCTIQGITLPNGRPYVAGNIEVWFHRERWSQSGGYAKYWVDDKGRCVISWDDDRGDAIEKISFTEGSRGYVIKDIMLKDGGSYNLKAKEN